MSFNCIFCKQLGAKIVEDSNLEFTSSKTASDYCEYTTCSNRALLTCGQGVVFPKHAGTYSVKCVLKGEEYYELENDRKFKVDSKSFLILNSSSNYASYLKPGSESELLSIFFQNEFVNDVVQNNLKSHLWLLDNYGYTPDVSDVFFEKTYDYDEKTQLVLIKLVDFIQSGQSNRLKLNEIFYSLFILLLKTQSAVYDNIEKIKSVKLSTRIEIYKRLQKAKEFIEDNYDKNISLKKIAASAYFSHYHFLRLFNDAFRITPHKFQLFKRLEKAKELLVSTNKNCTQICYSVGFESPSYFSRIFKIHYGISPNHFRNITN